MIERIHRLALGTFRRLPVFARRWIVRRLTPGHTVGAVCFVERSDGRLLLVRLSYRERWGAPGGLCKRGEVPADAARRETLEEVGIDVVLAGEPAVVVDATARRVDVVYRAVPSEGVDPDTAAVGSPEIVELAWFAPDNLPELQHETAAALVALARAARAPVVPGLPGYGAKDGTGEHV